MRLRDCFRQPRYLISHARFPLMALSHQPKSSSAPPTIVSALLPTLPSLRRLPHRFPLSLRPPSRPSSHQTSMPPCAISTADEHVVGHAPLSREDSCQASPGNLVLRGLCTGSDIEMGVVGPGPVQVSLPNQGPNAPSMHIHTPCDRIKPLSRAPLNAPYPNPAAHQRRPSSSPPSPSLPPIVSETGTLTHSTSFPSLPSNSPLLHKAKNHRRQLMTHLLIPHLPPGARKVRLYAGRTTAPHARTQHPRLLF